MRRRIGAVAVATAALLSVSAAIASAAQADVEPGPVVEAAADVSQSLAARELAFIRGESDASDLMGFKDSLYVGKWFMPGKEDKRKCILDRESNFNYRANNGTYFGAYQMSAALGEGAVWEMREDIAKEFGRKSLEFQIVKSLHSQTPDKWNRYWQDRAFWTIWSHPEGKGSAHWRGAGC